MIRVNQYCTILGYADSTAVFKVITRHKEYDVPVFTVELVSSSTQSERTLKMDGTFLTPTNREGVAK